MKDEEWLECECECEEENLLLPIFEEINGEVSARICSSMISYFENFILNPENDCDCELPIIKLYISSVGGSAHDMFAIYDLINFLKTHGVVVETYGLGPVMSAAIILLAAGSDNCRFSFPNTRLMIHQASAPMSSYKTTEIMAEVKELENIQKRYGDLLFDNSNLTREQVADMLQNTTDYYFSAEEAVDFGIIDEVLS